LKQQHKLKVIAMSLQRISGPGAEPVTLGEAKLFCRVDGNGEDAAITQMIAAARAFFERETGLVLVHEDWEWTLDRFPEPGREGRRTLELPLAPVTDIGEFLVRDNAGAETDIPPADYVLDVAASLPRLVEKGRGLWPAPKASAAGVRLAFTAGFGAAGGDVPADIRQSVLVLVAEIYEKRGLGQAELDLSSPRVTALLAPYRRVRL
jgi:uncharacterized phiE125 gp8 family phage protein